MKAQCCVTTIAIRYLKATSILAQGTIPFPFCQCYRFPDQNTEGFAGDLQPSLHQRNTRTSLKQNKTVK